jgi:hypothetical protein
MKQTAVEWLVSALDALDEQMKVAPKTTNYKSTRGSIIEQAKEMEKEQMIDFAFKYGDLTTRQIADSFDKEYKTNEK